VSSSPSSSRPAATVILTRTVAASAAGFEVLMLRRSEVGAFAGNWVFPGGRVDDEDPGHDDQSRARSAAVREAAEEVAASVHPDSLVVWSHWTPPESAPARFTTWFFVAPWAGDEVRIDNHEIVEHRWMSPQEALDARLLMAPPTIVTLHELIDAGDIDAIQRGRNEVPSYLTRVTRDAEGTMVLLWHGDAGYPTSDPSLPGPRHRLVSPGGFNTTDWEFIRDL
jgi:8-oxo-dGTP pyrophosphatase MutT (NUDIX family)